MCMCFFWGRGGGGGGWYDFTPYFRANTFAKSITGPFSVWEGNLLRSALLCEPDALTTYHIFFAYLMDKALDRITWMLEILHQKESKSYMCYFMSQVSIAFQSIYCFQKK